MAAFNDLMNEDLEIPERYVLYQDGDQVGWSREEVNGISLTPNSIVDMAGLLHIENIGD
jgi:hypothetical protein